MLPAKNGAAIDETHCRYFFAPYQSKSVLNQRVVGHHKHAIGSALILRPHRRLPTRRSVPWLLNDEAVVHARAASLLTQPTQTAIGNRNVFRCAFRSPGFDVFD